MTLIEQIVAWCKSERESLLRQIELMESGTLTTRSSHGPSRKMVDTTQDSIADCKRQLAEIEPLLARYVEGP